MQTEVQIFEYALKQSRVQIEMLQQLTKQQDKQIANLKQAWQEERDKVDSFRVIINAVNNMENNSEVLNRQYWAWMPYEDNHLETLSCPILIPAEWLRQLLNKNDCIIRTLMKHIFHWEMHDEFN